jgi:GT2 family glycosyltransferase
MTGNSPLFEVVIPNWNGRNLLKICLDSLRAQTYSAFRTIVVDNGSEDDSVAFIRQCYPEVTVIALSANTGFSHAVNCGIQSGSAPWVFLLNNDVEVAGDCLERLAEGIEQSSGYDFFALKMINYHDRDFLDGAGDAVLRGEIGRASCRERVS